MGTEDRNRREDGPDTAAMERLLARIDEEVGDQRPLNELWDLLHLAYEAGASHGRAQAIWLLAAKSCGGRRTEPPASPSIDDLRRAVGAYGSEMSRITDIEGLRDHLGREGVRLDTVRLEATIGVDAFLDEVTTAFWEELEADPGELHALAVAAVEEVLSAHGAVIGDIGEMPREYQDQDEDDDWDWAR